jgi:hypothetical protein
MKMRQDIGGQTITITFREPWWVRLAIAAARAWHFLRLPLDVDRFAEWASRNTKITIR